MKNGNILILILILFSNCQKSKQDISRYKIISSQILVTSDKEDKIQLQNSCKNATIYIYEDTVQFNTKCIFNETIKDKIESTEYVDSFEISHSYLNLSSRYLFKSNIKYKKINLLFKFKDSSEDSLSIIFDKEKLLVIYEPYLLEFQKMNTK